MKVSRFHTLLAFILSIALVVSASAEEPTLPNYAPLKLAKGGLTSVGSDSMGPLMEAWVQEYRKHQPAVTIQIASRGSASAAAALIDGSADLGPMARPMKEPERKDFLSKYGFEPTDIRTGIAVTAIYVSAENPIEAVSLEDLDAIYSSTHRRQAKHAPTTWSELGVAGSLAAATIMPVGKLKDSPVHTYFRQQVLLQGEYRADLSETADARSFFEVIKANPGAIAFGELAEVPAGVKVLAISNNGKLITPTPESIANDEYPLSRYLSLYFVREPGGPTDSVTKDFLSFILSAEGQAVVSGLGLTPLPAKVVAQERAKL